MQSMVSTMTSKYKKVKNDNYGQIIKDLLRHFREIIPPHRNSVSI